MAIRSLKLLFQSSLDADASSPASTWGWLLLRGGLGGLIFYIHGWHKLEGGLDYLRDGTPWRLAEEITAMHFPAPLASAFGATAVQFVCAPLLALGLFTRLSAFALTAVLGGAIMQNLLAARDPQLAILYTLSAAAFVLLGGGRLSLDAKLAGKISIARSHHSVRSEPCPDIIP